MGERKRDNPGAGAPISRSSRTATTGALTRADLSALAMS